MQAPDSQPLTNGAAQALAHAKSAAPTQVQAPQTKGSYQLQKLRAIHHVILRMAATGMKLKAIAAQLDVTEMMVKYTVNSELGQQKLDVLIGMADMSVIDVIDEFAELAPIAVEVIEGVMLNTAAKDADRINAADKILNGAGFGKRSQVEVNVHHVTDDEIQLAKVKAREMGRLAGVVVEDTEFTEIKDTDDS